MKLIVFFNGWGMNNFKFSLENEWEFKYVNYPYKYKCEKTDLNYEKIVFIGWSFGVYYLNKFLEENPFYQRYESIAINGTPDMLGERGIPEKMLKYTLQNLSEESLKMFYVNMGISDDKKNYLFNGKKDVSELKAELSDFIEKGSLIYEIDGEHFIFDEKNFLSRLVDVLDEIS